MVRALRKEQKSGDWRSEETAREEIENDALEITVRPGWENVGSKEWNLAEYRILITTGGPAVRIVGELGEDSHEPETARIEGQDWYTPWVALRTNEADTAILLDYARVFYFGAE